MLPDQGKKAVNDKQNEAITAASNELAKRKSDLEENLKLSHDLKVEQGAKLRGASRIIGVDKNPHKCEKAKAFGFTEVVDASSYQEPIAQTGVLPLFVPFAQASAAVLTAVLIGSLYYVAASPKDPTYVVAPVLQSRSGRQDLKKLFEAWYEKRQMKKIYSPLLEGLLALCLGFEWIQLPLSHMAYTQRLYWDMAFGKFMTTGVDYGKESNSSNQKKDIPSRF
ncbi:hypothetical protein AHAS_Ahas09G0116900 [Arachis hypogaea]